MGSTDWDDVVPADARLRAPGGTTAAQTAAVLRDLALGGRLRPGDRLPEQALGAALGVSRNTLREAFRLVCEEGLAVHEPHRGVFVRRLRGPELHDLWAQREVLECGALAAAADGPPPPPAALDAVTAAADRLRAGVSGDDWDAVGTANMDLHSALAGLAGSPRTDEAVRRLLAEVRLVFVALPDARAVHEPWVAANARLAALVAEQRLAEAVPVLREYLRASGRAAVAATS